jgi:hypothetical protein
MVKMFIPSDEVGSDMVMLPLTIQLLLSVTTMEYSPAGVSFMKDVFAPLFHWYAYGWVPPFAIALALPVEYPLH